MSGPVFWEQVIAGGATFLSNFFLWKESGYFDNAAPTKPLLHLWSLAIEEQFYIFFPFILWLAWKCRVNFLKIILVITLASFLINLNLYKVDSVADFYSPLSRFWELMMGSVLAYFQLNKPPILFELKTNLRSFFKKWSWSQNDEKCQKIKGNVASALGAFFLTMGFILINEDGHFPGLWALFPTLGAFLLIAANASAWINRKVLSNPILVYVGTISFPIYLWHWILLSFLRINLGGIPATSANCIAVFISFILAWLTYTLIEKPLRFGKHDNTKTACLLILMTAVGLMGYACYIADGLPFRGSSQLEIKHDGDVGHIDFHTYPYNHFYLCNPTNIRDESLRWEGLIRCFQSKKDKPIDVAIIGDSHAEHLFIGLAENFSEKNIVYYVRGAFPFLIRKEYEKIFDYVITDKNIKNVILTAKWDSKPEEIPKGSTLKSELQKTITKLLDANKRIYLTDDVPEFAFDPTKCKYIRRFHKNTVCTEANSTRSNYTTMLEELTQANPGVELLKTFGYFCDGANCFMNDGKKLLYRDTNHLNINGSEYLGKKLFTDYPKLFD